MMICIVIFTEAIDLSECHCENGGSCMKDDELPTDTYGGQGYYCICTEQYSGERCEVMGMAKSKYASTFLADIHFCVLGEINFHLLQFFVPPLVSFY